MKSGLLGTCLIGAAAAMGSTASTYAGNPLVNPAFTYQGELRNAGAPLNGTADFQFSLFAASAGGVAVAGPIGVNNVAVTQGRFTVSLNFGGNIFDGSDRYLEIAVRSPAGAGAFTVLAPRQRLAPTPYAIQTRGIYSTSSGNIGIGTLAPEERLHIDTGTDSSPATGGYLVLGNTTGLNLSFDNNEIMARANGGVSSLLLNASGGNVGIGTASPEDKLHILGGTDTALAGGGYLVLGSTSAANLSFDNNEIMARNNGAAAPLALNAAGGDVNLVPNGGGNVGIGTNAADARLHVVGGTDVSPGSGGQFVVGGTSNLNIAMDGNEIMARNNGGTATLFLNAQGGTVSVGDSAFVNLEVTGNILGGAAITGDAALMIATNSHSGLFGRNGSDGAVIFFFNDGTDIGSITVGGNVVSYNAFTGSHYACTDPTQPALQRGMLVKMTGSNRRKSADPDSEIIYGIAPVTLANDPACLGAYLALQEPTQPAGDDNPHLVMAAGNGEMWVIDTGADIAPGDLLVSSDVGGCAMKDDLRRFEVGHVIARAAERIEWSQVQPDERGVKRVLISVLFDAFTRSGGAEATAIADLQRENAALRAAIEELSQRITTADEK